MEPACPSHLFWEYDEDIRRNPPLEVAVPKITLLGDLPDIQWLIRRFGRERIREGMYAVRVVGADRKSVNMMCVVVDADISRVRCSPDWIGM